VREGAIGSQFISPNGKLITFVIEDYTKNTFQTAQLNLNTLEWNLSEINKTILKGLNLNNEFIVTDGKWLKCLEGENNTPKWQIPSKENVSITKDGKHVLVASYDSTLIYNAQNGSLIKWLDNDNLMSLDDNMSTPIIFDLHKAISIKQNGDVILFDFLADTPLDTLGNLEDGISDVLNIYRLGFDQTGSYFFTVGLTEFRVWDLAEGTMKMYPLKGETLFNNGMYISPNGLFAIYASIKSGICRQELHSYTFN
jgi:hypothetical protein